MVGKRDFSDGRNQLFEHYVRLLRGLKPRAFIMENVSGMVKGKMKLIFAQIMRELKASGYRVRARLMNAAYFGVPQARERLIFIGVREDLGIEPSHPKPQTRPIPAKAALEGLEIDQEERRMLLEAGRKYSAYGEWYLIPPGSTRSAVVPDGAGFTCRKYDPNRPAYTVTKTDGSISTTGGMHWAEPRRFTVGEYRRFGSFPDHYRFAGEWGDAVARIGNSVPPRFMQAIAEHVYENILKPSG